MKKIELSFAAALIIACGTASGQNFNPTVEVTNTYQGNASDMVKPMLEMSVPDSLLRFDLDFDYSVFEKRYDGSFSFKPYMLNMTPELDAYRGHQLFIKAGAGYSLHPEFDAVWSPYRKGALQMSLFASHKSYFGEYMDIAPQELDGATKLIPSGDTWKGYDALTKGGFEGRYNWDGAVLSFGAGYYGLHEKDFLGSRGYNALDFNGRIRSNRTDEKYFYYDFSIAGRFGQDDFKDIAVVEPFFTVEPNARITEGNVFLHGVAGPMLDYFHRVLVGVDAVSSTVSDMFHSSMGVIAVTPRYEFETGRWLFSLGLRVEGLFRPVEDPLSDFGVMNQAKGQVVYPAVNVLFNASDAVRIYASATGGTDINTYSSLIADNHHLTPLFQRYSPALMENTVEDVNAKIGVKGNICQKVQFDFNYGASILENGLLDGVWKYRKAMLPAVSYQDYNMLYANALIGVKAGKFDINAGIHYKETFLEDDAAFIGFLPEELTAEGQFVFNFNSRISAGFTLNAASGRNGNIPSYLHHESYYRDDVIIEPGMLLYSRIPGYVDLGFVASYQISRKFGVWGRAGNLLSETVQRNPFYAEKGTWGSLGITLTL